jgi:glycogen synthase
MLVDNGVHGDSRVQKQARSMADRGWDVILLGVSPNRERHLWRLGGARVRLIPVPMPMAQPKYEHRRVLRRGLLAYPPGPLVPFLQQQSRARQAELKNRRASLRLASTTGPRIGLRRSVDRAGLRLATLNAQLHGRWLRFRLGRTEAATARGPRLESPVDSATTAFWRLTMGRRAWRRLEPGLWDYELAFGPRIDKLKPDLIHANDFRMIGVGAQAAIRARAAGRDVRLVWDAHEYLPGVFAENRRPRWRDAHQAYEREFVPYADAVVTVSETMADLLTERFRLTTRPSIVLNAPTSGRTGGNADAPGVRELCKIGSDIPLLVYSGVAGAHRGLDTMIDGLPELTGVHVALVTRRQTAYVQELRARAVGLGVADRLHVLPYVSVDSISRYLSSADVGVNPTLHYLNHEVDLPTKFYEYSQARLPLVVSDVKTMAEQTRATGQGEVFRAGDTADYVRAVRAVLADPGRYRAAYDVPGLLAAWTWEKQADVLDGVYSELLPDAGEAAPR